MKSVSSKKLILPTYTRYLQRLIILLNLLFIIYLVFLFFQNIDNQQVVMTQFILIRNLLYGLYALILIVTILIGIYSRITKKALFGLIGLGLIVSAIGIFLTTFSYSISLSFFYLINIFIK